MITYWEKFKAGANTPRSERVHITLSPRGEIVFNRTVFYLLGSPRAVCLFFNRAAGKIGIGSAHPQLAEAFPVKGIGIGSYVVRAAPFCRHYNIWVDRRQLFVRPDTDRDGILHLDLATTVNVNQPKRRLRKKNRPDVRATNHG